MNDTNMPKQNNPLSSITVPTPPPPPSLKNQYKTFTKDEIKKHNKELEKKIKKFDKDVKQFKKVAKTDMQTGINLARMLIIKSNELFELKDLEGNVFIVKGSEHYKNINQLKELLLLYIKNIDSLLEFKKKWEK